MTNFSRKSEPPAARDRPPERYLRPEDGGPRDVRDLIDLLTVDPTGDGTFSARNPRQHPHWRLYGGQVAAQLLVAAGMTVAPDRRPHSLHCYFLRSGHPERPTSLRVDRVRDGRSFSVRHVVASQGGEEICMATASFHIDEPGVDYQALDLPVALPAPADIEEGRRVGHNIMFELRELPGADGQLPSDPSPSRMWARTRGPLPDEPLMHAAAVAYLSDMGWAFARLGSAGGPSLDHAVWFHRPTRADEWLLLDLQPAAAAGARGLYHGTIHRSDGVLAASLAQESLLRARGDAG